MTLSVLIAQLPEQELRHLAEQGDLLPQINPRAVVNWDPARLNGTFRTADLQTILLHRFFELARPIADACREPVLHMRLGDAGRFFYLLEALQRSGYAHLEPTLLLFLDEFSQLEPRSYNELYLWSIVELSRRQADHVVTFWPLVLTLDLRFRSAPWQRPTDWSPVEQPYRLIELVMYYYVLYSLHHGSAPGHRRYPSLATQLLRFFRQLDEARTALLLDSLCELARQERRPAFGDAYGVLLKVRKETSLNSER